MFDMFLNTALNYKDSTRYYDDDNTRALPSSKI